MVKTAVNGNLCNRFIRVSQKISAYLQAVDIHKINGRLLEVPLEYPAAFAAAYTHGSCDVIKCYFF